MVLYTQRRHRPGTLRDVPQQNRRVTFRPQHGQQVLVRANIRSTSRAVTTR